jgi:hypothetical protein
MRVSARRMEVCSGKDASLEERLEMGKTRVIAFGVGLKRG